MLEGVKKPGHLDELYGATQVTGKPQLLEIGDVPQIPKDWTQERIVLRAELLIRERLQQQERPGPGFGEFIG
jgi:hypothetical protein